MTTINDEVRVLNNKSEFLNAGLQRNINGYKDPYDKTESAFKQLENRSGVYTGEEGMSGGRPELH